MERNFGPNEAAVDRELLEWLAQVSTKHERQLQSLKSAEAEARREAEQLEWAAQVFPGCQAEQTNPFRSEFDAEGREFADAITGRGAVEIDEAWDPAKHPRTLAPPNPGWWARTSGPGGGQTSSSVDDAPAPPDWIESGPFRPGSPARIERVPFRSEDDPTPKGGGAFSGRGGVAIRGQRPSPFQLLSLSIDAADDDEAARLQARIARMGVDTDVRMVDGAAQFTLQGKPGEHAWDATGKELERSVLEGMLASGQGLRYNSLEELQNAVKTLAAATRFARTGFNFLSGELPKFPATYFDDKANLRPGVSPAAAVRAIYEHAGDVQMACRNCMQFAVMRALIETYGDKEFDRVINSYRDPSKPFNILDMELFAEEDAPLVKWTRTAKPTDIIPGQWVYALGNRQEGVLSGYERFEFHRSAGT